MQQYSIKKDLETRTMEIMRFYRKSAAEAFVERFKDKGYYMEAVYDRDLMIRRDRRKGMSCNDLCRKYQMSKSQIYRIVGNEKVQTPTKNTG